MTPWRSLKLDRSVARAQVGELRDYLNVNPLFTNRFNHGYSQVVDWLCLLDGSQNTPEFRDYWGQATPPRFVGVLVIGRSAQLASDGRRRLEWRSVKVRVNSHPVVCLTYDDLVARLSEKLSTDVGISDENPGDSERSNAR